MEEAPIKPDEAKKEAKINVPKKLWEAVDAPKSTQPQEVLSEIPLDYEADDAQPEDAPHEETNSTGAVSAGDILAERYQPVPPTHEVKTMDEQRGAFEQHKHEAEVQLDKTFAIGEKPPQTTPETIQPGPEIATEDLPETYFERRHEIKDNPGQAGSDEEQVIINHDVGAVAASAMVQENPSENLYRDEQQSSAMPLEGLSTLTQGVYWQAIKGGFWAAIAILIIIMTIAVVS